MTRSLTALTAKMAGLGTLTKATAAVSTAALTLTVAGGAAGVLPSAGGQPGPAAVAQEAGGQATFALASVPSAAPSTTRGGTEAQATGGASVTTPAGSGSARANTGVATPSATSSAGLRSIGALPTPITPALPALPPIPSCVANLIPTGGTAPDPIKLVAQLPACILSVVTSSLPLDTITAVIGSAGLPVDVSTCLTSVLGSVPALASGDMSGLPRLLSDCLPTGSVPSTGSFSGTGSRPGTGSFTGTGSFSGTGSVTGTTSGR